jgi:hypothetical protein
MKQLEEWEERVKVTQGRAQEVIKNKVTKSMMNKDDSGKYHYFASVHQSRPVLAISDSVRAELGLDYEMDPCIVTNKKAGGLPAVDEEIETIKRKKLENMIKAKVLSSKTPVHLIQKADLHELASQNQLDSGLSPTKVA